MSKLIVYNQNTNLYYNIFAKFPKTLQRSFLKILCSINNFRIQKLKTPLLLTYFVTNKCDARCLHCFYWKELGKNRELKFSEIEKIVCSLRNRVSTLTLTGGEPFLREDLVDICVLFYKVNRLKKINIPTNGLAPDWIYNCAKEILGKTKMFLSIIVSIDGLHQKHDEIRDYKGAFLRAIQTVKLLKSLESLHPNFKVAVQTVISNYNIDEIQSISNYVSNELGVQPSFQFIRDAENVVFGLNKDIINDFQPKDKKFNLPSINKLKNVNQIISKYENRSDYLLKRIQELKREYSINILIEREKPMPCLAGKIDGILYPNGEVALCEIVKPFANLRKYDLNFEKLWNSVEANKMRQHIKNCSCIHPCTLLSSMRYDYNSLLMIIGLKH